MCTILFLVNLCILVYVRVFDMNMYEMNMYEMNMYEMTVCACV